MKRAFSIFLFIALLLIVTQSANAQIDKVLESLTKSFVKEKTDYNREALTFLKSGRIPEAVIAYSQAVESAKQNRTAGNGVESDLLGEYAYALALNHDFEAALIYLDRCLALSGTYQEFYTAQVFAIMGFTNASDAIGQNAAIPPALADTYQSLTRAYTATKAHVSGLSPAESLKRANELAGKGQTAQSIAIFEELLAGFPKEPLVYISASTAWESLKQYGYASSLMEKGINLASQSNYTRERLAIYNTRFDDLRKARLQTTRDSWFQKSIFGDQIPQLMAYGGATVASGLFSLNARLGIHTAKQYSGSLNTGLAISGNQLTGSIGISGYKTWNIFVVGLGVNDQFSKDTNVFGLAPSVGLTFPDKSGMSSFDIMIGFNIPFSSNSSLSYSISIGKTVYFDLNVKR